jgi:hypothetical protein
MDDLEIELGVLDLVPPEVLGRQKAGRAEQEKQQRRCDASKHRVLG